MLLISLIAISLAFLESTLIEIPLTFVFLFFLSLKKPSNSTFIIIFIIGIILDILSLRTTLGITSIFFLSYFILIHLYQSKFEIKGHFGVILFTFFGAFLYAFIFKYDNPVFSALLCSLLSYILYRYFPIKKDADVISY